MHSNDSFAFNKRQERHHVCGGASNRATRPLDQFYRLSGHIVALLYILSKDLLVHMQSSWDTVTWSNTICGPIKVTEESIVDTLSAVTAAGFTTAIVVSNYPISPSINNVACNFACLYGGDNLEDLASIQQQFSGIFMNLEVISSILDLADKYSNV
jgi:hypothetical protein